MPNIASVLKDEIARVARNEVSAEVRTLRKLSAQHRSPIATLRRQFVELEKRVRALAKTAARASFMSNSAVADEGGVTRRFSASRLAALQIRLGLSAASYGALVGVSGATIYNWEQGKGRPGKEKLEALAAVRELSKAEAQRRLARAAQPLHALKPSVLSPRKRCHRTGRYASNRLQPQRNEPR